MTQRNSLDNAVSLNSVRYRIAGPVLSEYLPQTSEKVTIGAKSTKDLRNRNTIIWNGFYNGMLLRDIVDIEEDTDAAFWAYAGVRYPGHTVLPPLATQTASVSGATSCPTLTTLAAVLYGTFNGTDVRKYTQGSDSWGSSLDTLPAAATDAINVRMAGTEYAVWATTTGYTYTSDGAAFTDDGQDTKFMAFWDNRLWGITNGGLLWWSKVIGTEFTDAQLPLPDGSVQGLFVGRSTNAGRLVLYASTTRGLFVHEADSNTFEAVDPDIPEHQDNGLGYRRYLDSTFYAAGLGVYRFINQPSQSDVSVMGLDRKGGMKADHVGNVVKLTASHQELIALVNDASNEPGIYGWRPSEPNDRGVADPKGTWVCLWDSAATGTEVDSIIATTADAKYRLYWSYGGRINFMDLPRNVLNPLELSTYTYQTVGEVITPWLDGQEISDNKLAVQLFVNAINATSTETIVVDYEINESGTFVALGTITADGVTTYTLGATAGEGISFSRIRFRFTFARGSTNTNTPDMGKVEFHWVRPEVNKWRHTFNLKWEGLMGLGGNTAQGEIDTLINAVGSTLLLA